MSKSDFGLIGLAVMGQNLVLNVESRGFQVSVYNRTTAVTDQFIADNPEKKLVGSGGVSGAIPAGTFSANSLHADLNARTISLDGNARLHMIPGKLRMP